MFKLWYTIVKDLRILIRDKVGIALMFWNAYSFGTHYYQHSEQHFRAGE